jgi:hypothetical protein
MSYETPSYIKALLKPNGSKPAGRRVWSIDLEAVWLPTFTAMNVMGETRIPHEALGAPLRLAYNGDGTVKFSKTGRPVVKVVKEIADSVKLIRENLVAGLVAHAHSVATENADGYKAEVMANQEAGRPIIERDRNALTEAVIAAAEAAEVHGEADKVLAAA